MSAIVLVVCLLIIAIGVLGLISPEHLIRLVKSVQTPAGLYSVATLRVLLGVALGFAASTSRVPGVLRILGVVVIVAGLVTPFFGVERFRKLLDSWWSRGAGFIRVWAGLAATFGLLLIYLVTP